MGRTPDLTITLVSGLPCVSYDCLTGPADLIVDGDNGLLVPVGNFVALAKALDRLASDRSFAEHLGVKAATRAEELKPSRIAESYLAFCGEAAGLVAKT